MSASSNDWIAMHDREPRPGQLVLIRFTENLDRVRVCYFDNYATWSERNPDDAEDFSEPRIGDEYRDGWFSEQDDPSDWWCAKYVECWMPVPPLPGESDE